MSHFDKLQCGSTTGGAAITNIYYGSATWDPGNLVDGAQESKDFTVTGAELGDFAIAAPGVDVTDLLVSCVVTADDTVTVTIANETGGAVNLASSTWKILVLSASSS